MTTINKFYINKYVKYNLTRGDRIVLSVIDIFDSIITLISLGTVGCNYGTHFMFNQAKKRLKVKDQTHHD